MPFKNNVVDALSSQISLLENAPKFRNVSNSNSDDIVKEINKYLDTYYGNCCKTSESLTTHLISQREDSKSELTLFLGRFDVGGNPIDVVPPIALLKRMLLYYDRIIVADPLSRFYDLIHGVGIRIAPWTKEEAIQIQSEYAEKLAFMHNLLPLIKQGVILPLPYNILVPGEPSGDHLDYLTRENIHLLKHGYPSLFTNMDEIMTSHKHSPTKLASVLNVEPEELGEEEIIGVGFVAEGTEELFFQEGRNTVQRNTGVHIERISRRHGDWPEYLSAYCLFERLMNISTETRLAFFFGAKYFTDSLTSWQLINYMAKGLPQLLHFFRTTRAKPYAEVRKAIKDLNITSASPVRGGKSESPYWAQTGPDFILTNLELPYLENLAFPDVFSLRNDEAFGRCRNALRRLSRISQGDTGMTPSPEQVEDIIRDVIKPEFNHLDKTLKNLRNRCFQSATLFLASLAVGAAAGPIGLIPFGLPAALQLALNIGDVIDTRKLLKEHDLYFLWKLKENQKP